MSINTSVSKQNSIDRFRLPAAFLITAIHTAPLSSVSETADYLFTYCFSRIAVPFFLMTTGYFVLSPCLSKPKSGIYPSKKFGKSLRKTLLLYLFATLLYLPVNLYSGKLSLTPAAANGGSHPFSLVGSLLKVFLFDGTFYHLWYLPASLTGCLLLWALLQKLQVKTAFVISFVLYLIGLMGDSWYGLAAGINPLKSIYSFLFSVSSYTRNGFFYAPVFLLMGACLSQRSFRFPKPLFYGSLGAFVSLLLMLTEGYVTYRFELQRHSSMYLFLVPCMFFFFQVILALPGKPSPACRRLSLWVYLLHPICILLVRGAAKVSGSVPLLVENSLIHYLAVCLTSLLAAVAVSLLMRLLPQKRERNTHNV